ncbi:hypothetical protein EI94DRAFT_1045104 [Lactarius quietus]|nr:hypothetical protein EI94DRAFT_1045104 [Lactarius quietus]
MANPAPLRHIFIHPFACCTNRPQSDPPCNHPLHHITSRDSHFAQNLTKFRPFPGISKLSSEDSLRGNPTLTVSPPGLLQHSAFSLWLCATCTTQHSITVHVSGSLPNDSRANRGSPSTCWWRRAPKPTARRPSQVSLLLSDPPHRPPCLLQSRRLRTSISPAAACPPALTPSVRLRSTPPQSFSTSTQSPTASM